MPGRSCIRPRFGSESRFRERSGRRRLEENRTKEAQGDLFAAATCRTVRLKLLKIGAPVRLSARRVKLAMASAFPCRHEYALAHERLRHAAA